MGNEHFIRPATFDDVLEIMQIQIENYLFNPDCKSMKNGCNHNLFSPFEIKDFIKKRMIMVASRIHNNGQEYQESGKDLLGYIIISRQTVEESKILQLCVDENHTRMGIGSELLGIARNKNGALHVLIFQENMAGKYFLQKNGFQITAKKIRHKVDDNKMLVTYEIK